MPWSGAGTYSLPAAYSPEVNGTIIDATRYNGLTSDVAIGITAALAKNGENAPTANLPMGGFKHTGAADATAAGQYLVFGQTAAAFALGAVGAPSITFVSDPNTGMWSPAADTLAYSVGGVEILRLASAASTFTNNLFLTGAANIGIQLNDGTVNSFFQARTASNRTAIGSLSAHGLGLWADGIEYVTLNAAGNAVFNAPSSGTTLQVTMLGTAAGAVFTGALSGASAEVDLTNTSNTASSDARLYIATGGASSGDPYTRYSIPSVTDWSTGIDNSDNDAFKFSQAATIGTNDRFGIETDGRLWGDALHNNAGAVTGTTKQFIASGTYTPTLTNGANVAASTAAKCQWLRVGNVVTVYGGLSIDVTSASAASQIDISLPIASNLAANTDLGGTMIENVAGAPATYSPILANTVNNRATAIWHSGSSVTNNAWYFSFGYEIL